MRTDIPIEEARRLVLEATPVLGTERALADTALGRVLAETVHADRTLPPTDVSAMDGWALRASEAGSGLAIAFEVAAGGGAPRALEPGEAARIFTGAPLPPGADCVVRQEDAQAQAGLVRFAITPRPGDHVREAGEDVRAGDAVLAAGTRLGPAELGMLASLGRTGVAVHQRPRVALLSGGDELIEPDAAPEGGRIVASNAYSLAAQCREAGAEPHYLGIARDDPADLERLVRAGLGGDVLVSTAGVSVGDHDHVREVLAKVGVALHFWGVRMKPGYPLAFGRLGDGLPLVFGLPGNPVSAMITFEQFVRPALRRLAGHRALFRPRIDALLAEPLEKKAGRVHFVRVRLTRRGDAWEARSTGNQSSGVLRSMTEADGLLIFPADAERLEAGARVSIEVADLERLASEEPLG